MAGMYGVFSMQPKSGSAASNVTNADEVRFGKTVADIAVEAGVRYLVYTSAGIISKSKVRLKSPPAQEATSVQAFDRYT